MKRTLKTLAALLITCGLPALSWAQSLTTNAFGQDYDYLFVGSAEEGGDLYTTVTNWKNADGTDLTLTKVPGLYNVTDNGKMLLHGDNISVAEVDGYKTITFPTTTNKMGEETVDQANYLAGEDLQIGVANKVCLENVYIENLSGDCEIRIDSNSKAVIHSMFVGYGTALNKADLYVASAEGLKITAGSLSLSGTFNYHLDAEGSVAYTGNVSSTCTHHIASLSVDLGDSNLTGKKTVERTLITFGSQTGQSFTIADDIATGMTLDSNLDNVGDYALDTTSGTSVVLKYVAYAEETSGGDGDGDGNEGGESGGGAVTVPATAAGYDYFFLGDAGQVGEPYGSTTKYRGLYSTAANWRKVSDGTVVTGDHAPGTAAVGAPTGKILLHGDHFAQDVSTYSGGKKDVTFALDSGSTYYVSPNHYLSGDNLDLTLRTGVQMGDRVVIAGFSGECAINIDASSRLTVEKLGVGENKLNDVTITVNANNGFIVNGDVTHGATEGTATFTYNLNTTDATVAYTGAVSGDRTHHFATIAGIDLGDEDLTGTRVITRTVMNFADTTNWGDDQTITFTALSGMTEDATLDTAGDYTFEKTADALVLKYVKRVSADIVVNIPEVDTSLTAVANWSTLTGGEIDTNTSSWKWDNEGYRLTASGMATVTDGVLALGTNQQAGFSFGRNNKGTTFRASKQGTVEFYVSNVPTGKEVALATLCLWEDRTPPENSDYDNCGEAYYLLTATTEGKAKLEYAWMHAENSVRDNHSLSETKYFTNGGFHVIRMAYKNNTCTVTIDGNEACVLSEADMPESVRGQRVLTVKEFNIAKYLPNDAVASFKAKNLGLDLHGVRLYSDPEKLADGTVITESYVRPLDGAEVWVNSATDELYNVHDPLWGVKTTKQGEADANGKVPTLAVPLDMPGTGAEVVLRTTAASTLTMDGVADLARLGTEGSAAITFVEPTAEDATVGTLTVKEMTTAVDTDLSGITATVSKLTVSAGTTTLGATSSVSAVTVAKDATLVVPADAEWELPTIDNSGQVLLPVTLDTINEALPEGSAVTGYLLSLDEKITIAAGETLTLAPVVPVTILVPVENNGTLTISEKVTLASTVTTTGAGALIINGGTLSGDWVKDYDGPITLNGATLDAGTSGFALKANQQYIAASGTSTLKIYNGSGSSEKADTDTEATVQVKSEATLHLYGRDFGGFYNNYQGEKVRVYVAGTLIAESYDSNPGCFSAMMVLDNGGIVQGGDASTDAIHFYSAGSTTNPNIRVLENATAEWRDYLWWNNHNLFIETQAGATLNLSATFKGNGSDDHIYKLGTGKLCISGEQADRTGNIIVEAGTLQLTGVGSLGSGSVTVNSGMFEVVATATKEVDNTITATAGTLKTSGAATVTFSGAVTAATTVIDTDTTFTETVNLGAVTIAEGKTLTVPASTTFTSVTGPGNLVVSGTGALRLLGVTFGETLPTITIPEGAAVRLTTTQQSDLGDNLVCNGTLSLATNSAFGKTFTYVFNGGTATYETISNWDCFNGATLTDKAPNTQNSNKWEPILLDGDQMLIAAADGYKTVNAGELEAWNLQLGITNGVHLKATSTRCMYGGGEKWIYIGADSKLTVGTLSSNDSNNHGTTLHIYGEEGFEVTNEVTNNSHFTYTYHLYENGSAVYKGGLGSTGTQTIASMTLDLGTPSLQKEVKTRKLIGFASQTSQTFSITASGVTMAGATPTATTTALTGSEDLGTYRGYTVESGDAPGYYVEYIGYGDPLYAGTVNDTVEGTWSAVVGNNTAPTLTVAGNAALVVDANTVVTTLNVTGTGSLTLVGENTLSVGTLTIAEGMTVTVGEGVTLMLPANQVTALGNKLVIAEGGKLIEKTNTAFGTTFTYVFNGGSDAYGTLSNWDVYGTVATNASTEHAPGISGSNRWEPILLDGNQMLNVAEVDGYKTVTYNDTNDALEGWNLRLGVANGAKLKVKNIKKFQGGETKTLYVDETSKLEVTGTLGSQGTNLQSATFYVYAEDGLTVAEDVTAPYNNAAPLAGGADFTYHLKAKGSVQYAGISGYQRDHIIASMTLDLGTPSLQKEIKTRKLIGFSSQEDQDFSITAAGVTMAGATPTATTTPDTALTGTEDLGTYRGYTVASGDAPGYYVEYIGYKPIANLIALWDDFEGLEEATEGLAPKLGATQTQNSITLDGATLKFYKEGGTETDGILSTGTTTAPRIDLAEGDATVNVGHDNFPITVVMAIEAPVPTTRFGKPFVHQAHATNTSNGIGIALQSTDYICGTWTNNIYSNGDHKWEITNLSGTETLYLLFTNMSGGSRVGFVADGTVTWKNCFTSSLRASNLEATDIFFGNYQGADADGMDFKLKSVALLAGTGTSLNASILACVNRMEMDPSELPTDPTWVGTTSGTTNTGTWNTTADNKPWQVGLDSAAFANGDAVVFKDITGATTSTVTIDANVSPASILVENKNTAYTLTPSGGVIQGGVTLTKRGSGTLNLSAMSERPATNIAKLVVEEGTVTSGNYALQQSDYFGPEIEVKGGTLDLANSTAWNATADSLWLTKNLITMGGSARAAEIKNGNIVPYKAENNSEMDFLKYVGTYTAEDGTTAYAPPATFAAAFANVYSNANTHYRSVIVEQGAGSREGGVGYDLEMTGGLGTSGQYAKAVLRKKGDGVLKISSINNIPTLSIEAGTVMIGHEQALSATTTIAEGATLDLNGFALEDGVSLAGTGTITNTSETKITLYRALLEGFTGTIDETNITLVEPTAELTWMPFGDSITEGESSAVSYRHALWKKLTAMGYNIRSVGLRNATHDEVQTNEMWSWHNAWYGGFSMPIRYNRTSLYDNVDTCLEAGGYPDIITVLIGTNDAASYSGTASRGPQNLEWRFQEWVAFIDRLATLRPHSQIFVSTPPKNRGVDANIATLASSIRAAYAEGVRENMGEPFKSHTNVHFVDMWEDAGLTTGDGSADFIADGTHPSASGCDKIAEVWKTAITAVVDTKGGIVDEADAPVIVEAFNPTADTIQVRFNKPLAETQSEVTASLTGADGITLTYTSADTRTVTFTASAALPTATELTVSVSGVTALDETTAAAATKTFTALGNGAEANVPEAYREGFVLRQARDIPVNATTGADAFTDRTGVTVDSSTIEAVSQVAYYVELKREGKPAQFVWVSMDAFDYREAMLGIPTTTTGNHQQEVTSLRVYGNRGNFDNTAANETAMKGIVEFTPYSYTAADSNFTTIPDLYAGYFGWRDTLGTSGSYGCMQVAQIVSETAATPTWAAAKMLFAINGFNTSTAMDLGIGSFATHLKADSTGNTTSTDFSHDWTFVSATGITDVQPSAYTDARILEVWVKPMTIVAKVGDVPFDSLEAAIEAAKTAGSPLTILSLEGVEGTLDLTAVTIDWAGSTLSVPANVTVRVTAEQLAEEDAQVTVTEEGASLQIVMSAETILAGRAIVPAYLANEKVTVGVMKGDTFVALDKEAFDENGVYVLPEDEPFVQITVEDSAIVTKGSAAAFYTLSNPDNKVTVATENKTNSLGTSVPAMAKATGTPASVALNIPLQNTTVSFWATRAGANWDDSFGIDYVIGGTDTTDYRMQVWERNASNQVCVYGGDSATSGGFPAIQNESVPLAGPFMSCADNNLHHWVVVTKATTQDFYMDGIYQGTRTYSAINTASKIESIGLGGSIRRANNNNYGTCSLADVRVYRSALNISEIDTLYRGTKAKFTATIDDKVKDFSDIPWEDNVTGAPTAEDAIVLNVSGNVTLNVASALTAGRLMVNVAETATNASLTLTGSAAVTISTVEMNASLDVSQMTGTVALSTAKVGAGATFAAKATNFTSVSGEGTLYLTAGTLVHSDKTSHHGLTIHVAKGATFKATADVAADSGTDFILEGGSNFLIPAQKWVNVPITVAENTEPAKIYGASGGNDTAFKGEIILNGDLELADAGGGGGNKYRIEGVISGKGKLIVNDVNNPGGDAASYLNGSSIQLNGNNTFSGGLVIGAGVVLNTTQATSVGAGDITIAATGTLKNGAAITLPAGKKLAGGGTVTGDVTFADGALLDATAGVPTIEGTVNFTTNLTVALPALAATSTEATKVLAAPDGTSPTNVTYTFTLGGEAFDGTASWDAAGDLYVTPSVTVPAKTTVDVELTEPVVQEILKKLKEHNGDNGTATDVLKITAVTVTGTNGTQLDSHSPEAAHLFTNVVEVTPTTGNDGTATITYDFGIDRFTIRRIGGVSYIVLKARVKGGNGVDFADGTAVKVYKNGTAVTTYPLTASEFSEATAEDGVRWLKMKLDEHASGVGTHGFIIKAEK